MFVSVYIIHKRGVGWCVISRERERDFSTISKMRGWGFQCWGPPCCWMCRIQLGLCSSFWLGLALYTIYPPSSSSSFFLLFYLLLLDEEGNKELYARSRPLGSFVTQSDVREICYVVYNYTYRGRVTTESSCMLCLGSREQHLIYHIYSTETIICLLRYLGSSLSRLWLKSNKS